MSKRDPNYNIKQAQMAQDQQEKANCYGRATKSGTYIPTNGAATHETSMASNDSVPKAGATSGKPKPWDT
jgi:hypothetical protein